MHSSSGLILGIESSCDETAAAIVRADGCVLASAVASQIALHTNYGGVVPELASREHLRNIVPVVRAAMAQAAQAQPGLTFADLDAIAVTAGPGLAGALLVGITYAKALALALDKPLIAVNHLEGHIHAVVMEARARQSLEMPLLALVVSGGHTHLYLAEIADPTHDDEAVMDGAPGLWQYRNVGRTVDDAAGEAYDKVAKLLALAYPGGPWIDALATHGNPRAVEFHFAQIKPRAAKRQAAADSAQNAAAKIDSPCAPHPGIVNKKIPSHSADGPTFDFSFSGIKTAVLRYTQTHQMAASIHARQQALAKIASPTPADALALCDAETLDLIASFQYAVIGNLIRQTTAAAQHFGARGVLVSGGVSANRELRRRFTEESARRALPVAFPTPSMSTDNAAMIAAAAWPKFRAARFAPEDLVATPQLKLG